VMAGALAVFFAIVLGLGFRADLNRAGVHISAAFFMVICILFLHSLVVFFLIGSGRSVREEIHARPWAKPYLARINDIRLKAFPPAILSMMTGIVASWIGAAAHTGVTTTAVHRWTGIGTLVINLVAFAIEWRQLQRNSWMIAECQRRLDEEYDAVHGKAAAGAV